MKPFSLTIEGKRWRVVEGDPGKGNCGICDPNKRTITIRKGGTVLERVGTITHEVLHAVYPDLDEPPVLRGDLAITAALHKAGLLTEDD